MGSVKYGFLLLKKNITFSFLIMLLVFVAVIVLNIAFSFLSNTDKTYSLLKDLLTIDGGYLVGPVDWDNADYTPEEIIIERYEEELGLLRVARAYSTLNGEQIEIQAVDSQLLDLLSFPIKGEMPITSQEEGIIPVITDGAKIGDEYKINLGLYGEKKVTLRVVGTMGTPFPFFDMAGGSSTTDIIKWGNNISGKKFICSLEALLAVIDEGFNYKFASFVKFKDGVSEDREKEIILDLNTLGTYFSIDTLQSSALKRNSKIMSTFLPLGITIILVAAINFLICIVLSNSKNKKLLAILYVSGAKFSNLFFAVFFHGLLLSFFPSVSAMVVFITMNPLILIGESVLSWEISALITSMVIILFVFLNLLGFALTVKQSCISSILKGAV